MDELMLTNELKDDLISYMVSKKPPYNTLRTYSNILLRIFREHKVLNKQTINILFKRFKHQNERAVLVLIKKYCYDYNIDFKIHIPELKGGRNKQGIVKTMSKSEIDIIINSAGKPYDLAIKCILKIGAGLRISECIKLSWGNFYWPDWIEKREEGLVNILYSKGGSRVVTVPKSLMEELYNYAKEENILNELGIPIGGQIFPFDDDWNAKLRETNLKKWKDLYLIHAYRWFNYNILQKRCEKALGKKIKIHSLRHSRAMELYEDYDMPIEIIQKLLGHREISTTQIYAQVSTKKVIKSMKGVE